MAAVSGNVHLIVKDLASQVEHQRLEMDTFRTWLQSLQDEVFRVDRHPSGGVDISAVALRAFESSMQSEINAKFDKIYDRIERMEIEPMQDGVQAFKERSVCISDVEHAWAGIASCARDDADIAALRTRLECLQDEVRRIDHGQKRLVDRISVSEVHEQKAEFSFVEEAMRSKADQGNAALLATLRTRLERLQDEVDRNERGQKSLADKAWVNEALKEKADISWVERVSKLQAEQGDSKLLASSVMTRLECLQDEVRRLDRSQKNVVDKAWINNALEKLLATLQSKVELLSSLPTRLDGLQDELCRTAQYQKCLADKDWVASNFQLKDAAAKEDSTLQVRLQCLHDKIYQFDQRLKFSTSSEFASFLQLHVRELSERLRALIHILLRSYSQGIEFTRVERVGGGYEYADGIGLIDQEAVKALSALDAEGWPSTDKHPASRHQSPKARLRSGSPRRIQGCQLR